MKDDKTSVNRAREQAIRGLVADQHRQATTAQLRRIGVSTSAIHRRVQSGRMHREHQGVFSIGLPAQTHHELAHGAVLACGPYATLGRFSAHQLWGFIRDWSAPFEVVVPSNRKRPGIVIYRAVLHERDMTNHYGIPVTTPARTFLDTARALGPGFQEMIDRALLTPFLTLGQLEEMVELHPHHANARLLQTILDRQDGKIRAKRERHFPRQCLEAGLPRPVIGRVVLGRERDAWFEAEQLIVELDDYETHAGKHPYEDDRERDTDAYASAVPTIRITVDRQFRSKEKELRRLGKILARRRAELPVLRAAGVLGDPIRAQPLPVGGHRRAA